MYVRGNGGLPASAFALCCRLCRRALGCTLPEPIANSTDLNGLPLKVDLAGVELARGGEAREQGEEKKRVKPKLPPQRRKSD